jgi:hypothetical protein
VGARADSLARTRGEAHLRRDARRDPARDRETPASPARGDHAARHRGVVLGGRA